MEVRSTLAGDQAAFPDVLVIGCGYVGQRLCAELEGRPVTAVVRSVRSAEHLQQRGIQTLQVDLDQPAADWCRELPQVRAIIYLAPPPTSGRTDPRLANCLQQLQAAQVFVYMSTTGVYGDAGGARVNEHSPVQPLTDRAHRRVDAETQVQSWCAGQGSRAVILRVPGIYGPQRLPLERLRQREPAVRREDAPIGNRIHVDDLAMACRLALDHPAAQGVYNVCDGDALSPVDFLDHVALLAGLPAPPRISLAQAQQVFSPARLSFLEERRHIDASRIRRELGWQPRFGDPREGIRASLGG